MNHTASIQRLYELLNAGDIEGFSNQIATDFVERDDTPGFAPTKAGVTEYFKLLLIAFPDLNMKVLDVFASGDKAVARVRASGTNKGPFMGMPATGKRVEVNLIDITRFSDEGLALEHWGILDQLSLMQQLGVIPAGPAA